MFRASLLNFLMILSNCCVSALSLSPVTANRIAIIKADALKLLRDVTEGEGAMSTSVLIGICVGGGVLFLAVASFLGYKYHQWVLRNSKSKEGYRALAKAKASAPNQPDGEESPVSPPAQGLFATSLREAAP